MSRPPILRVEQFGQIASAEITFGNLTVLVGPQATGKSLLLQLLKLHIDRAAVLARLKQYGFEWSDRSQLLDLVLGEGMSKAWRADTRVELDGKALNFDRRGGQAKERVFYIPAHRALTLGDGWPQQFQQYGPSTPYVAREFSAQLNELLLPWATKRTLFPEKGRVKTELREAVNDAIFHGAELRLETEGQRRQLKLNVDGNRGGFMSWTVGQREFVPLLLGCYYLMPPTKASRRGSLEWVILEEPEMGLHPEGLLAVMALGLELVRRDYRVVLSTHSPLVLDVLWAIEVLRKEHAPSNARTLCKALGLTHSHASFAIAEAVLVKRTRVFALEYADGQVHSKDISALDPGSNDATISGWGGLTGVSGEIHRALARRSA